MATLPELLRTAVDKGASDLHITIGTPPQVRVDGELVRLDLAPLTPTDTKELCYCVLTDEQKKRFEETRELDFSFGIRGLARFRGNIFMQRGAVGGAFRQIPERSAASTSSACRRSSRSSPSGRAGSSSSPARPARASRRRSRR